MRYENFLWGSLFSLFVVVGVIFSSFLISFKLNMSLLNSAVYILMALNLSLVVFEVWLIMYYQGVRSGKIDKEGMMKDLLIQLNAVKQAEKEIKQNYFKRKLDKDSYNDIVNKLRKDEVKLKNQIEGYKNVSKKSKK